MLRYQIPAWDGLTLQQKAYIYHLSEAAKFGRNITWDQYCKYNLPVRHALETILEGSHASVSDATTARRSKKSVHNVVRFL